MTCDKLLEIGNPLEKISLIVDFEIFRETRGRFVPGGQGIRIFLTGVKPNWPRLNSYCLIAGSKLGSKKSIWIYKLNMNCL
jgi:hypothetical protein